MGIVWIIIALIIGAGFIISLIVLLIWGIAVGMEHKYDSDLQESTLTPENNRITVEKIFERRKKRREEYLKRNGKIDAKNNNMDILDCNDNREETGKDISPDI